MNEIENEKKAVVEERLNAKGKSHMKKEKRDNPPPLPKQPKDEDKEEDYVPLEYNTLLSFFDNKASATLEENLAYMKATYGFELVDEKYICDLAGLVQCLGEKIYLGAQCIYCNKGFNSREACWAHMKDVRHMRVNYANEDIMYELENFYDFSASYVEFEEELKEKFAARLAQMKKSKGNALTDGRSRKAAPKTLEERGRKTQTSAVAAATAAPVTTPAPPTPVEDNDENDDEWEDVDRLLGSSDEEDGDSDSSDGEDDQDDGRRQLKKDIASLLAKYGLRPVSVTEHGTLRLMDGREVLSRHAARYNNRAPTSHAVSVAQSHLSAAGRRIGLGHRMMMLTDGSGNNMYGNHHYRDKNEIKEIVREHRRQLRQVMEVGVKANKMKRFTLEYQKGLM